MAAICQAELDEPTKARLVAEARELKAAQETKQPVELLPTLTVQDIPVVMERTVSEHADVAGVKVQWDDQPTNGITFVSMMYDLSEVRALSRWCMARLQTLCMFV